MYWSIVLLGFLGDLVLREGFDLSGHVCLLTVVSFIIKVIRLVVNKLLSLMTSSLNIDLKRTNLLVAMFSLTFTVTTPILLAVAIGVRHDHLVVVSLTMFLTNGVITMLDPLCDMLLVNQILTTTDNSLLVTLYVAVTSCVIARRCHTHTVNVIFVKVDTSLILNIPVNLVLKGIFN